MKKKIGKLTDKHFGYIEKNFGYSKDDFLKIYDENGEAYDKFFDEMTWRDCDAADHYEESGEYTEDDLIAIEICDILFADQEDASKNGEESDTVGREAA